MRIVLVVLPHSSLYFCYFFVWASALTVNQITDKRKEVADRIKAKYPDRIPVCSCVILLVCCYIDGVCVGDCGEGAKE